MSAAAKSYEVSDAEIARVVLATDQFVTTSAFDHSVSNPHSAANATAVANDVPEQTDFGRLGILLFFVAWICVGWTVWLGSLALNPVDAMNQVFGTQGFEDDTGTTFWAITDPDASTKALGIVACAILLIAYFYVVLKLAFWQQSSRETPAPPIVDNRNSHRSAATSKTSSKTRSLDKVAAVGSQRSQVQLTDTITKARRKSISRSESKVQAELERVQMSVFRNKYLWMKAIGLAIQSIRLVQILWRGLPVHLGWIYMTCMATSSLFCALIIHSRRDRWVLGIAIVDVLLDFFNAVLFPMTVLISSINILDVDRKLLAINMDVFPPRSFERRACSAIANPVQLESVYRCLKFLRITSPLDFVVRVGLNIVLCYRTSRLIDLTRHAKYKHGRLYPKRHPIALPFLFFALLTLILVIVSVNSSEQACAPHPTCAIHSRRWVTLTSGELDKCPCLALVDVDDAPRSYDEWLMPHNVSEQVARLAATGDLEVVHLVNRRLDELPDTLKSCSRLRSISLVHTDTNTLPAWMKQLDHLEYLYIEGKLGVSGLQALPSDLFESMTSLSLLALESHENLTQLPPLNGLKRLRSLVLERLPSLTQLPDLTGHTNSSGIQLERLQLSDLPLVSALPDLAPVSASLTSFAFTGVSAVCCNGFVAAGTCDLNRSDCSATTCALTHATDATRSVFETFATSVCQPHTANASLSSDAAEHFAISQPSVDVCNGTLYQQCTVSTSAAAEQPGMCYNARLQVVHCDTNALAIEMRRRQIAQHVGPACDPNVEAWLGCT